jgi:UDP-N-acetyl-D-mannosaminuronic acid dehydrogenase
MSRFINDSMPSVVFGSVMGMIGQTESPTITILGVSYKANVDDTRETPARKLMRLAENRGCTVKCHDPLVKDFDHPLLSLKDAVKDSDCVVLMVNHEVFREIDPSKLKVRKKNLFDTRNFLDHERWAKAGFKVKTLGGGSGSS